MPLRCRRPSLSPIDRSWPRQPRRGLSGVGRISYVTGSFGGPLKWEDVRHCAPCHPTASGMLSRVLSVTKDSPKGVSKRPGGRTLAGCRGFHLFSAGVQSGDLAAQGGDTGGGTG